MTSALRADGPPVASSTGPSGTTSTSRRRRSCRSHSEPALNAGAGGRTPVMWCVHSAVPAPAPGHRRARSPAPGAQARRSSRSCSSRRRSTRPGSSAAQQNARSPSARKERVGVAEIAPAGRLLTELADARALAVRSAGGDADAAAALPAARKRVAVAAAALDAADRRLGAQLGHRKLWKRLQTSIQATVPARPTDAAPRARRLRPPDRRHPGAHRPGRQRLEPHPRPRPRLLLRMDALGEQGARSPSTRPAG